MKLNEQVDKIFVLIACERSDKHVRPRSLRAFACVHTVRT